MISGKYDFFILALLYGLSKVLRVAQSKTDANDQSPGYYQGETGPLCLATTRQLLAQNAREQNFRKGHVLFDQQHLSAVLKARCRHDNIINTAAN